MIVIMSYNKRRQMLRSYMYMSDLKIRVAMGTGIQENVIQALDLYFRGLV